MIRKIVLCFAVLLAVIETGTCLKCYRCNSVQDRNCGQSFSQTDKEIDCNDPVKLAEITTYNRLQLKTLLPGIELLTTGQNVYCLKVSDNTTTGRTCVYAHSEDELNKLCKSKPLKSCQYCSKELCNASSAVASSVLVAIISLVVSYLVYKH